MKGTCSACDVSKAGLCMDCRLILIEEAALLSECGASFKKLRHELQAVRWAMWYAIDAWNNEKPWGIGFGGLDCHETDVGISLVKEGRTQEREREARGMNELMAIEQRIATALEGGNHHGRIE